MTEQSSAGDQNEFRHSLPVETRADTESRDGVRNHGGHVGKNTRLSQSSHNLVRRVYMQRKGGASRRLRVAR
jgi:hypothetical protein